MIWIMLIIVIIAVICIWQRQRVLQGWHRIRPYCIATITPPLNNWILLGLLVLTILLFLNAIYQGGGEPLGTQALKEIVRLEPEDPRIKYLYDSVKYVTGEETAKVQSPQKSWIWWKIAIAFLLATIIYCPFAFWDEITRAYHRAQEILAQRRIRIQIRPAPQPIPQEGAPQTRQVPPAHQSIWTRFRERFWASFSADMISETIFELGGQLLRRMIGRR